MNERELLETPRREIAEELIRALLHRVEENTAVNIDVAARVTQESKAVEVLQARVLVLEALYNKLLGGLVVVGGLLPVLYWLLNKLIK